MTTRIPLLDLQREYAQIAAEIQLEWSSVFASMRLLAGEQVKTFEAEIAAYLGARFACGVASGTDAILLGLEALGIGSGDRVILPANSFIAAIEAIHHRGATPILVDVAGNGFGPDLEAIAAAFPAKALLLTHLYGHILAAPRLITLCDDAGCLRVEDASHAHGATCDGRHAGT